MRLSKRDSRPSRPAESCILFPMEKWHSTTVVCVRHAGKVAMASDGQVTLGTNVMKQSAAKIRRLKGGEVIAGFAGSSADAFALFSRFESKLEEHRGNLERSAIELAKDWRTDKMLRQLEALLIVADKSNSLLISGTGDLISPEEGVLAIGSGGAFALAAARALLKHRPDLTANQIAREGILIASQIDIYTNDHITIEEI